MWNVIENWKFASRCQIASGLCGPLGSLLLHSVLRARTQNDVKCQDASAPTRRYADKPLTSFAGKIPLNVSLCLLVYPSPPYNNWNFKNFFWHLRKITVDLWWSCYVIICLSLAWFTCMHYKCNISRFFTFWVSGLNSYIHAACTLYT
jgi:hypothetical protein